MKHPSGLEPVFFELASRSCQEIFTVSYLAFRNRPSSGVLVLPKRAAWMHQEDF
jgi:hypothetical protein